MVTPPPAPVGNQSTLAEQQTGVIAATSKANITKLITAVGVSHQVNSDTPVANTTPVANLQSHGVGTQAHHSA